MGKGAGYNLTTLRLLHYPPLRSDWDTIPGQMRCHEHVDVGSITLLFQDRCAGLQVWYIKPLCISIGNMCTLTQVKHKSGDYIDVPYHPDAVLVNLGAMAENWTNSVYPATVSSLKAYSDNSNVLCLQPHRVLLPLEESDKKCARQSLAFFCHPDNEAVMTYLSTARKFPLVIIDEHGIRKT